MERIGPYRVEGELARGGMGVVYLGRDSRVDRSVVIKLLLVDSDTNRRRLQREAKAMAQLCHPNLLSLHGVGDHEGSPYLVLPHVQGESLQDRLNREGPLPVATTIKLGLEVGRGLAAAHARGLIHRDVKPANVLLGDRGEALLTDFGLVKQTLSGKAETLNLSIQGRFMGTPGFWPPEQAFGRHDEVGAPADVYGLGGLLYALLSGQPPRSVESLLTALQAFDHPVLPLATFRSDVPAWLDALIMQCLESHAGVRPELAEVLETLEQQSQQYVRRRTPRRVAWSRVGLAFACVTLLAAAAVITTRLATKPEKRPAAGASAGNAAGDRLPDSPTLGPAQSRALRALEAAIDDRDWELATQRIYETRLPASTQNAVRIRAVHGFLQVQPVGLEELASQIDLLLALAERGAPTTPPQPEPFVDWSPYLCFHSAWLARDPELETRVWTALALQDLCGRLGAPLQALRPIVGQIERLPRLGLPQGNRAYAETGPEELISQHRPSELLREFIHRVAASLTHLGVHVHSDYLHEFGYLPPAPTAVDRYLALRRRKNPVGYEQLAGDETLPTHLRAQAALYGLNSKTLTPRLNPRLTTLAAWDLNSPFPALRFASWTWEQDPQRAAELAEAAVAKAQLFAKSLVLNGLPRIARHDAVILFARLGDRERSQQLLGDQRIDGVRRPIAFHRALILGDLELARSLAWELAEDLREASADTRPFADPDRVGLENQRQKFERAYRSERHAEVPPDWWLREDP